MVANESLESAAPPAREASPVENTASGRKPPGRLRVLFDRLFPRPLTKAERDELAADKRAMRRLKEHESELKFEAETYAQAIVAKLTNLGICYRYKKSEKDPWNGRVKEVKIRRPYVLREEAVYLEVDLRPGNCPPGIGVEDLSSDKAIANLSMVCGHKVLARYSPESGFWYIVERQYGVRGIPGHVKMDELLASRPAQADGLSLPLGVGENKKPVWRSLGSMYSMLVAGTVGGGKSNFLSVLICSLLRYNRPSQLKLMLIDLKGGVEFNFFREVPHLLQLPKLTPEGEPAEGEKAPAIIEHRQHVAPALRWLVREGERRMELLKASKVKTIGQYNYRHNKSPMTHIVLVIDEWADVKLEPKIGKAAEELLINIASRFRAVGIHVVLCTQVPNKDVVSIRIKNVLPARVAFACPDYHGSMLIIGNGRAAGLSPEGRAIFDWGRSQFELQTPYMPNSSVDAVVEQAVAGKFNEILVASHDVTDQEILEWALDENGGSLAERAIHTQFRTRGYTLEAARAFVKGLDGDLVVIGASTYKVVMESRKQGRRLLAMDNVAENET